MRTMVCMLAAGLACGCGSSTFTPEGDADAEHDGPVDVTDDGTADPAEDPPVDPGDDGGTDPIVEDAVDVTPDVTDPPDDSPGCTSDSDCLTGLNCCVGRCVNLRHDPDHCGGCGSACATSSRFCNDGTCTVPPCEGVTCIGTQYCCGTECCDLDQICCEVEGPGPWLGPMCYDDVCPGGCPECD